MSSAQNKRRRLVPVLVLAGVLGLGLGCFLLLGRWSGASLLGDRANFRALAADWYEPSGGKPAAVFRTGQLAKGPSALSWNLQIRQNGRGVVREMSGAALPRSALVWDGQLADGGLLPPGSECQAILSVNVPDKGYQLFTDTFLTGLALKRGGDGAEAVLGGLRFLTADSPAGMAGSLPPADVARLEGLARLLARLDNPVLTIQAAGADPAAALERAALVRRILQAARLGVGRVLLVAMPDDAPRTSDIRIVLAPQTMEALALLP